ncbi:hypothetical protein S83_062390 [Arachis hypogaea]
MNFAHLIRLTAENPNPNPTRFLTRNSKLRFPLHFARRPASAFFIAAASLCNPDEMDGILFHTRIGSPNPGAPDLCLLALVCHCRRLNLYRPLLCSITISVTRAPSNGSLLLGDDNFEARTPPFLSSPATPATSIGATLPSGFRA